MDVFDVFFGAMVRQHLSTIHDDFSMFAPYILKDAQPFRWNVLAGVQT